MSNPTRGPAGLDPLPRCLHDKPLLDGAGEILVPSCGCRWRPDPSWMVSPPTPTREEPPREPDFYKCPNCGTMDTLPLMAAESWRGLIRELEEQRERMRRLIAWDAYAIQFQTIGQYRDALLGAFDLGRVLEGEEQT